jgi:hypothetical protein
MHWATCSAAEGTDLAGRAALTGRAWTVSESRADGTVLRLAFRYGVAAPAGIIVDGAAVCRYLRAGCRTTASTTGWGVDAEVDGIRQEVREDIAAREPDRLVVEHWKRLGGTLPSER